MEWDFKVPPGKSNNSTTSSYCSTNIYRIIHKSLRDFRPLRYSSRNGHAEEKHVNRERDTPSFCPTLQVLDMCTLVGFWGLLTNVSRTCSTVSADGPGRPLRFAAHRQPLCWNFIYHSLIVLSVGGSVHYMVRNLHCTITIDSVLANSKTQNAFLFTVYTIFHHDYPLSVEPASTPRPLAQKKLWEILYLLICSFLPCLSWLLRSLVQKFRRDLWITLYKENEV